LLISPLIIPRVIALHLLAYPVIIIIIPCIGSRLPLIGTSSSHIPSSKGRLATGRKRLLLSTSSCGLRNTLRSRSSGRSGSSGSQGTSPKLISNLDKQGLDKLDASGIGSAAGAYKDVVVLRTKNHSSLHHRQNSLIFAIRKLSTTDLADGVQSLRSILNGSCIVGVQSSCKVIVLVADKPGKLICISQESAQKGMAVLTGTQSARCFVQYTHFLDEGESNLQR
jgi:hypothetical protein